MVDINNIEKILKNVEMQVREENIHITEHAHIEMVDESITIDEVLEALLKGEVIENYPCHKRGSCCLVYGKTKNKALHIVCTTSLPMLVIITVYEPNILYWLNPKERVNK